MLDDGGDVSAAVAAEIFQLDADFAERLAFPCHRRGRQSPVGVAGHMGWVEVGPAVTGRTGHAGCAVAILAAHDQRLMRTSQVRLTRAIARPMAIHAARMLQQLADFLEQGDRPRLGIGNVGEAGHRTQFGRHSWPIGRRRLADRSLDRCAGDQNDCCASAGEDEGCAPHTVPRTIGSWRGRLSPRRASALATAGPIGGTPGSPTPVGFSLEGTILTSTSGIS